MNLKGSICINRVSGGDEKTPIKITVTDENSNCQFLELNMTLADFALALTGQSGIPCNLKVRALNYVGSKHESENRVIDFPIEIMKEYGDKRADLAQSWLDHIEAEKDGWNCRVQDVNNHHRHGKRTVETIAINLIFVRNIGADGIPIQPKPRALKSGKASNVEKE